MLAEGQVSSTRSSKATSPSRVRCTGHLAASLASCTAVTMEMYAERKGWNVDGLEVDCRYTPAERGCPTRFELITRMPAHLSEEQVERLQIIAAKCPVHRTLEGEVAVDERVELT